MSVNGSTLAYSRRRQADMESNNSIFCPLFIRPPRRRQDATYAGLSTNPQALLLRLFFFKKQSR